MIISFLVGLVVGAIFSTAILKWGGKLKKAGTEIASDLKNDLDKHKAK